MHQNISAIAAVCLFSCGLATPAAPIVESVSIVGTRIPVKLGTQVGLPFDAKTIEDDVHRLWQFGRFSDVRVEAAQHAERTAVVFSVVEQHAPRLRSVRIEPASFNVEVGARVGTQLTPQYAHEVASQAREQMISKGYPYARVDSAIAAPADGEADLKLTINPGRSVRVSEVAFAGAAVDSGRLRRELYAVRIRRVLPGIPGLWNGWRLFPAYSSQAVASDLARLRSFYLLRGYFDATVRVDDVAIRDGNAAVRFLVEPGPLYRTAPRGLCSGLLHARREAQREGVLDFSARMTIEPRPNVTVQRGPAYRVGRIEFTGNHHYGDDMLRRNLLLDEGEPFDEMLLRKSVARLNRTGLFDPIRIEDVAVRTGDKTAIADVRISVKERKRGAWRISGPAGPASLAGPLQASLSSRLLSTFTVSVSMLAFANPVLRVASIAPKPLLFPIVALHRPYSPGDGWRSGFAIAPQLGWRAPAAAYAITQIEQRVLPLLAGDRDLIPELPVLVERPNGDVPMVCVAPGPRLAAMRNGAAVALQFLSQQMAASLLL